MASEVGICNIALQKIGAARIVSLKEEGRNANSCNSCYEEMRDAELEAHRWNFAKKRVELTADSEAEIFDDKHVFTLPADCLRVLLPQDIDLDWQIENGQIITNEAGPLRVIYVRRVTDPNDMNPLFREVVACRVAAQICEQITQSNAKLVAVAEQHRMALKEARRTNAFQSISVEQDQDSWINARR